MTMRLVRTRKPVGFQFASVATRLEDGTWNVPIDDETAMRLALERVRGEADDGVVSRLIGDGHSWVAPDPLPSHRASDQTR